MVKGIYTKEERTNQWRFVFRNHGRKAEKAHDLVSTLSGFMQTSFQLSAMNLRNLVKRVYRISYSFSTGMRRSEEVDGKLLQS